MCWVCDADGRASFTTAFWASKLGVSTLHFSAATAAFQAQTSTLISESLGDFGYAVSYAEPVLKGGGMGRYDDASGPLKPITSTQNLLVVGGDDTPNDISTNRTIAVDGPSIIATIETIGDQDYFKVQLEAGKTYDIGQYAYVGGPGGLPLADAYIELYDANGNLVTTADGGGPNTPQGLDALLTFVAKESGTYYINARSFDQDATNGTAGDMVGDYELFVKDVTGAPTYTPYYDVDSPLHSLDWGSQIDRTSRNPDGAEGPRPTGNEFTGTGSNPFGIEGKNVVTYYFAKQGDVFLSPDPTTPGVTADIVQAIQITDAEKAQYRLAFQQYSNVADVVYVEVSERNQADFKIITYLGTPGPGASLLGRASPPNEESEGQMEYNAGDERYNAAGLTQGGFFFTTLLHEIGHAHGLAHPHDNGGRSSIMRGAGGGTGGIGGAYGDFGLSQGVFTVMSYNDGYDLRPDGTPRPNDNADNGWVGTLSPLDIAVIQDKYGVNEEFATGDDVYILRDVQETGTFYQSIWDAGGSDLIRYEGARNAVIDLRAATLNYEEGGGGRVSYVTGINGGFTIANAVTIENATSDAGNDVLTGNDAANILSAGAGNDTVSGGAGADTLIGGLGIDRLNGGDGADRFRFESASDSSSGAGRDVIEDFQQGSDLIDLSSIGGSTFVGNSAFSGQAGQVRYAAFDGATIVELDANGDGAADFQLELSGNRALQLGDFVGLSAPAPVRGSGNDTLLGTSGHDTLYGYAGDDVLSGSSGNDRLIGGTGADRLTGGSGKDVFVYETASDSTLATRDLITDFARGSDKIDLSLIDADGAGGDSAFAFIGKNSFSGNAGELRYFQNGSGTFVEADLNGDALADLQIALSNKVTLAATDFIL